jgi:RsmE family RNA methyltransferase
VRAGVVNGPTGTAEVVAVTPAAVTLRCRLDDRPPPRPRADLLLALPRPKVMRRLWAPLASLGVRRILLANAARVERQYFATHWLRPEVYTPRLIEGLEQAGDTWLPEVSVHRRFRPLVEDDLGPPAEDAPRLVATPDPGAAPLADWRGGADDAPMLAIGPEGGWVPFELELLGAHGFAPVSLGGRTLRSDVAAVAALAMLQAALARARRPA